MRSKYVNVCNLIHQTYIYSSTSVFEFAGLCQLVQLPLFFDILLQIFIITIIIYLLTARVAGALLIISQPVSSIFPCSPLPSGTWQTPGLSIPQHCLPTSSSVCLVFFPFSLCLGGWFWLDLMNGRHDYTAAVCVSLRDQHKEQSQHCISGVSILFLSYFGFLGTRPAQGTVQNAGVTTPSVQ